MAFALLAVGLATPFLALAQLAAMGTGLFGETRAPRLWHRLIVRALGIRIHVEGRPAAARPLLIAANHVSWTDIMVLGASADVHFVARADLVGGPVMRWLASLQRTVPVERERRRTSPNQVRAVAERLAGGRPVVLFAEGTTGDGNRLLAFKSTLFAAASMALEQVAAEGGAMQVQPVAIVYTHLAGMPIGRIQRARASWIGDTPLLPHVGRLFEAGPLDVELRFGEPVTFAAGHDRKALARLVEARVRAMVAQATRGRRNGT